MSNYLFRFFLLFLMWAPCQLLAADWSTTEVHFQYGDLVKPYQDGGSEAETEGTTVVAFQHASGWEYGDNYFFFDYLTRV